MYFLYQILVILIDDTIDDKKYINLNMKSITLGEHNHELESVRIRCANWEAM